MHGERKAHFFIQFKMDHTEKNISDVHDDKTNKKSVKYEAMH